ncbi:uncharacterized protein KY384_006654 [Bacidia gigantensis]|uniref:uncharacterized protein n=1 Tax=Bacidia gigantensis TaxID=2732470 RepID=UPI001D04E594|nr:uncharacterized protein KY384_006654 [Bacidia gigantensis]KAG8528965.1 hypothetical protein KY384_006654 [Bacidia gigantensis]
MMNYTTPTSHSELPPLPAYTLTPRPALIPWISDKTLTVVSPIIAYWLLSGFFHWIDTKDFFPQYRLHTPAEILKRNRASRWEVFRDVIIQQVVQMLTGMLLNLTEPDDFIGKDQYDIAVWARRIRLAERAIPNVLSWIGIDAMQLGKNLGAGHPILAGALSGGHYAHLRVVSPLSSGINATIPTFAPWELLCAKTLYWLLIPAIQFTVAIIILDTWQYFLHRAMHHNKYLYTTFHSRHHRLYVPYAYGALYNHPFEGFLLDTLGASIAFKVAGMTTRQGGLFFSGSTFKTVDDHCGYALPWDPLQHITGNNAGYHDVHHQSWGIKTNFSQPFFTFWDHILGTKWVGGDVSARYEKSRIAAQKAMDTDQTKPVTGSDPKLSKLQAIEPYQHEMRNAKDLSSVSINEQQPRPPSGKAEFQAAGSRQQILDDQRDGGRGVLVEEAREEREAQTHAKQSLRRRATSSSFATDSLKGLSQKLTGGTCMTGMGSQ